MHESRGATAAIIGIVSLLLVGATWFYFVRERPGRKRGGAAVQRSGGDPYSNYMRDVGEIADSLGPARPGNTPANPAGIQPAQPGQPVPAAPGQGAGDPRNPAIPNGGSLPGGNPSGTGTPPTGAGASPR